MPHDGQTRRHWLATCAGAAAGMTALAGCTGSSNDDSDGNGGATEDNSLGGVEETGDYGAWPMARYDAANRLSVPHDGLDDEPEILWTAALEGNVEPPVVYDDTAFVGHDQGTYSAVDLTDKGNVLWEYESDGPRVAPAVSEAAVYIGGDGVEALDRDDKEVLWTTGHDDAVESLRIYDETIYAGIGNRVVALNEDGDELLEIETAATVQSLAIDDEQIYVRSRLGSEDDFLMSAYEHDSDDPLWEHKITQAEQWSDDRHTKTFPLVDGTVYTIDDGSIVSINGSNGEVNEVAKLDRSSWTRPTVHDELVFARVGGPTPYDLESGETPAEWDPEENTRESVVISGESVYAVRMTGISSPQNVMSMDIETGDINWEKQVPELSNNHSPVILNGLILVSIDDPGLVALG